MMKTFLKSTVRALPKETIYRVAGAVAFGGAASALAVALLLHPYFGVVIGYAAALVLLALVVAIIATLLRLKLVGLLRGNTDHLVPTSLKPWIRSWALVRLGLLGSGLIVVLATAPLAVSGGRVSSCVDAFVYITIARMLVDLVFGAATNIGVISRRHVAC